MSPEEVSGRVRDARLRLGLTHEGLAVRAGVVRNTVARIEQGRPVQRASLAAVYRALGWPDTGPDAPEDEAELRAIKNRLRGTGLPESELDIAARSILDERRNTRNGPRQPSPAGKPVVGEREGA